jgi:hypothetical protein
MIMTTQAAYIRELESTADKHVQTPVSYTGAAKMIWPLATESPSARSGARFARFTVFAGVAALIVLFWLLVTTPFYVLVFGSLLPIAVWVIYTQSRRHRIRDARSTLAARDQHLGSGAMGPGTPPQPGPA